jgi:hypothetical protein
MEAKFTTEKLGWLSTDHTALYSKDRTLQD